MIPAVWDAAGKCQSEQDVFVFDVLRQVCILPCLLDFARVSGTSGWVRWRANRCSFRRLSIADLLVCYGTDEQCHDALVATRWADGLECPKCSGARYSFCEPKKLFQCSACYHQTPDKAGISFHKTRTRPKGDVFVPSIPNVVISVGLSALRQNTSISLYLFPFASRPRSLRQRFHERL